LGFGLGLRLGFGLGFGFGFGLGLGRTFHGGGRLQAGYGRTLLVATRVSGGGHDHLVRLGVRVRVRARVGVKVRVGVRVRVRVRVGDRVRVRAMTTVAAD